MTVISPANQLKCIWRSIDEDTTTSDYLSIPLERENVISFPHFITLTHQPQKPNGISMISVEHCQSLIDLIMLMLMDWR